MSSSMSATEMYTLIQEKDTQGLYNALSLHILDPKTQASDLYKEGFCQKALYYVAESKEGLALHVTKLLMTKVFTSENPNTISTILIALDKALTSENQDFIVMVLDHLEPASVQKLLVQATPELLTQLLTIQPKLLDIEEKGLLSLLGKAFESGNIELTIRILQKQPQLLAQLIDDTNAGLNPTIYAQIANEAPGAIKFLFDQAIAKKNLHLVASLLEQNIPLIQQFSKEQAPMMVELLKDAIEQGKIALVVALLNNNPELLYEKAKATGKKAAVWAAKQKQWDILNAILTKYPNNHKNGDFHMALLWALKEGGVDIILQSDLDLICTSAETLDYEQNILHYAMSTNRPDLIKKILGLDDKIVLQALIVNTGGLPPQTPIKYGVYLKHWAAVWCYFETHGIQTERKEDITKLKDTILIEAVKNPCDEAQLTALAILDAAAKVKYTFSSDWIIDIINVHFLNEKLTELQEKVFYSLLNVHMQPPKRLFENGLNVATKLFIQNLLNIKAKIESELFKKLVSARKNGRTAIVHAAQQSRWDDVSLLAQQYNPENPNEYNACGYFDALEKAIKEGSEPALNAALALLDAADKAKYTFNAGWIADIINALFINIELTELQKKVFSRLLSVPMQSPEKLFEDGLNVAGKFFIQNLLNIQENIAPELFKQLVSARRNGKTAIEYAVEQSRWEDISLLAEEYKPKNNNECKACGYHNALEKAIKGEIGPELRAALALIRAIKDVEKVKYAYNWLSPKINELIISKPITALRNEILSELLDLEVDKDETLVRLISDIVCGSEKVGTCRQAISPPLQERSKKDGDRIKANVLEFIGQIDVPQVKLRVIMALLFNKPSSIWQKDADSLSNGTRLTLIENCLTILSAHSNWRLSEKRVVSFLSYILDTQNNDVLKMALGIIGKRHVADMTDVVMKIIEPIAKMLANEPSAIQLNVFNRLLENCRTEGREAIISEIAIKQSAKAKQEYSRKIVGLIQAIDNSEVKIDIMLYFLSTVLEKGRKETQEFLVEMAKMISDLIKAFIIQLKPLELQKLQRQGEILTLIRIMGDFALHLKPGDIQTELLILQDFLRIIAGQPSCLIAIGNVEPDKIKTMIKGLYRIIIIGSVLEETFLRNLKSCGANSKSLVYEAMPTEVARRSLSKANTAGDTSSQKPPISSPAAEKATSLLSSFPLNPSSFMSSSSSSSSSFFSVHSASPSLTPASGLPVYPEYPAPSFDAPPSLTSTSDSRLAEAPSPSAPPLSPLASAPAFLAPPPSHNSPSAASAAAIAELKSLPPAPSGQPEDEPPPPVQPSTPVDENNNNSTSQQKAFLSKFNS